MRVKRHKIQFPQADSQSLAQDEVYFSVIDGHGEKLKLRFHDYDRIYTIPGLYEQVFYDRLKCTSPKKVAQILSSAIDQARGTFTGLRVLDLGAGNGLMGEALKEFGVSRLVGVDIIPEARMAVERDRPHLYDDYYVKDFTALTPDDYEEFESWQLDCLVTVAALGFGDIPTKAFMEAFNIIRPEGWVAFNIKETFLDDTDTSGFSRMIRELVFSRYLNLYHLERYRHRLSVEGEPLYYYAIAARKNGHIPEDFMARYL